MSAIDLELEEPTPPEPVAAEDSPWEVDKNGKEYVGRKGKSGIIYRKDGETVDEARERDAKPKDQRPRRRTKPPKAPDPPKKLELKELEAMMTEALKQPAIIAAMAGDQWAEDHFLKSAPYLARNLIVAAEHNPWLKRWLEEASVGQEAMMKIVSLAGVGGALFLYIVPPVIYFMNLPVPNSTRAKFGIPDRREAPNAASPPGTEAGYTVNGPIAA
jgi:hypothetical protein